ncbi:MAG: DNA-binding domain-containing protein [Rhodospirillaceae bacterium]|nr:DNA-binding domain-containing protein [Rhodospirillaceae bacterium]
MKPTLRDLQTRFTAALLDGDLESIAPFVQTDGIEAVERLHIYRNHSRISLAAALADNFPVTFQLVGKEFFDATAKRFIANHPPAEPCLSAYGALFPDFLANFEPARGVPYLADVARLEWLRIEVTYAALQPALDLAALGALPTDAQQELVLALASNMRLLTSNYPIDRIWHANQEPDVPAVDLSDGGCRLLVWANADGCRIERLTTGVYAFFAAATRNETLAQGVESAMAAVASFDLSQAFALHRAHGVLSDTIDSAR